MSIRRSSNLIRNPRPVPFIGAMVKEVELSFAVKLANDICRDRFVCSRAASVESPALMLGVGGPRMDT